MAVAVTIACGVIAFPVANYMARYAAAEAEGVLLRRRDAADVDQLPGQGLRLAADPRQAGHRRPGCFEPARAATPVLDAVLATPVVGGPSLASSYLGMFIVFVYMWLPFMILPLARGARARAGLAAAGLRRPRRAPGQTFRNVVLPLALPGLAAGSIFTFSLTLGDYIIPSVVGAPGLLHRHDGLPAAGHGRKPAARGGVLRGADRADRALPGAARSGSEPSMRSRQNWQGASLGQKLAAAAGLVFLHAPVWVIVLYAFTTEDRTYQFPPPGLTLHWFEVAFAREDIWQAMRLSLVVASVATLLAHRARHARRASPWRGGRSAARNRSRCCSCCRSRCPASSPASRCSPASALVGLEPGFWTIVAGHATFCLVIVYNNVVARLRRIPPSWVEASMDLGADGWQTFRYVLLPQIATRAARRRHARLRAVVRRDHRHAVHGRARADPADLVLQRAVPAARAADHQRRRRGRHPGDAAADPARVLPDQAGRTGGPAEAGSA